MAAKNPASELRVVKLKPIEATPESFKEFGQVIEPCSDQKIVGPDDAQLDLSNGSPRFYIMRTVDRPLKFSDITHHAKVTQCLGAVGGQVWYIGTSKPSIVKPGEVTDENRKGLTQSRWGHFYVPPTIDTVCVFRVSGSKFLKLDRGTWHAGPLFKTDTMDFYNLELTDTNDVDKTTHYFDKEDGVTFVFED